MGNNVSLISAVTATTISSSTYNTNQNALNNAACYTYAIGRICAISKFSGGGFGTYTHGLNPYTPAHVGITQSNGSNGTTFGYGSPSSTTVFISANTGLGFTAFCYSG